MWRRGSNANGPSTRRLRSWLALGLALGSTSAAAHDADVIYARLEQLEHGSMIEIVTLTNATLGLLAPIDADGDGLLSQADLDARAAALAAGVWDDLPLSAEGVACARSNERAQLEEGFVTLTATWRCGGGTLRQDFKILRILPTNYRVVLGSQSMGERGRQFAQGVFTALELPRPSRDLVDAALFPGGFRRGVADGLTIEGLAALLVLAFSTRRRWLLAGSVAVVAGAALTCAVRQGAGMAGVVLVLGATALLFTNERGPRRWLAPVGGFVLGAGLGLRAGSWAIADGLGWLGALILFVVGSVTLGWLLGERLSRWPRAASLVRWGLLATLCFTAGLRFAADR